MHSDEIIAALGSDPELASKYKIRDAKQIKELSAELRRQLIADIKGSSPAPPKVEKPKRPSKPPKPHDPVYFRRKKIVRSDRNPDRHPVHWAWDEPRELAATLVAKDDELNSVIASKCGVSIVTLASWKNHPEFKKRVEQHLLQYRDTLLKAGIMDRYRRIQSYDQDYRRIQNLINERAEEMADVPGGKSGLLVRDYKAVGRNDVRETYKFDSALVAMRNELRKQIAQELGQWMESGDVGALDRLGELIALARGGPAAPPSPVTEEEKKTP